MVNDCKYKNILRQLLHCKKHNFYVVYDIEEAMEFAFEEWEDVWEGRKSDLSEIMTKVYSKGVEAIVDMPHSHFFDHFLEEWPKAKVRNFNHNFTQFQDYYH